MRTEEHVDYLRKPLVEVIDFSLVGDGKYVPQRASLHGEENKGWEVCGGGHSKGLSKVQVVYWFC